MENSLHQMETKLQRREYELEKAVEDCKIAYQLDKNRLKSTYEIVRMKLKLFQLTALGN